jgi:[ribosomal protein S5]-alanine N-acetyltransferase
MPDLPLPIVGTNVVVRKLYKKDLRKLYELEVDKEVKRYVGGPIIRPRQEWIEGMRRLFENPEAILPLTIFNKATGDFVGRATLYPKDEERQRWEMQIVIAKRYWGQRLGREVSKLLIDVAFHDLRASSIIAIVDPNNTASRGLVDALGFRQVGTKQSDRWDNGHLVYQREREPACEPPG